MKIPCQEEVRIDYGQSLTEAQLNKILDDVQTLLALVQGASVIIRHLLEENPPMFAMLIEKFLILNHAEVESLLEVQKSLNATIKEIWAVKFGGKEGSS